VLLIAYIASIVRHFDVDEEGAQEIAEDVTRKLQANKFDCELAEQLLEHGCFKGTREASDVDDEIAELKYSSEMRFKRQKGVQSFGTFDFVSVAAFWGATFAGQGEPAIGPQNQN
jgi:hypothetical protein